MLKLAHINNSSNNIYTCTQSIVSHSLHSLLKGKTGEGSISQHLWPVVVFAIPSLQVHNRFGQLQENVTNVMDEEDKETDYVEPAKMDSLR